MFLIRESQQHGQCFVLSLCHKLKIKHYLVIPVSLRPPVLRHPPPNNPSDPASPPQCEEGGRKYFTIDDGVTLFIDLLQLVEFHQINRGILPVCLKHPCVCVAL